MSSITTISIIVSLLVATYYTIKLIEYVFRYIVFSKLNSMVIIKSTYKVEDRKLTVQFSDTGYRTFKGSGRAWFYRTMLCPKELRIRLEKEYENKENYV